MMNDICNLFSNKAMLFECKSLGSSKLSATMKKVKKPKQQIEKSGLPCLASRKEKVKFAQQIKLLISCDQRMFTIRQMTYTTFDTQLY